MSAWNQPVGSLAPSSGNATGSVADRWNGASRKESRVTPAEEATRQHTLANLFDRFAEGKDMMSEEQLKSCCRDCGLLDKKLEEIDVAVIFSSTKLGNKRVIPFELFSDAVRKVAVKKGITFTELVTHAKSTLESPQAGEGFSAANAAQLIQEGGVAAKKKQMFEKKKPKEDAFSAKMASRHRKFGGGVKETKGDVKGFSAANARMEVMRSGGVANRAAMFGGGGKAVKNQNADFNAAAAKKDIRAGAVANRSAAFGGPGVAVAGPNGDEDGFSAANAAKEIGSGAVSARKQMFGFAEQTQAHTAADDGFSAANARKEIGSGAVSFRAAMFTEPAKETSQAGSSVDLDGLQDQLTAFYKKLNPENLHKVPDLIHKTKGDGKAIKKLNKKLKKKYGLTLDEFEAGVEPTFPQQEESSFAKARKLSTVNPDEIRERDEALQGIFNLYCSEDGMTEADLVRFCEERELIDDMALSAKDVGMIFSSTKLGKKSEINFTVFMEACRKIAVRKEVTFTELVQVARGLA